MVKVYDISEGSESPMVIQESLEDWVQDKCEEWREHYEANY